MVGVDQSTLDDDHFAYCYDKPRKTDVEKLSRFEAEYKSQQDTGKHNCFCDHGGPDCDICGERIKKDIEENANQRMLEALHDVLNNQAEAEAVSKAFNDFVISQRGRLRFANSARIAYEKELTDEIKRLTKAINDAINYCYKYEAEHEPGAIGTDALLEIWQDLQWAVGR